MATIVLTGGGTAGHCIPNVALLPYLKNKFDKIYYIGSKNGIEEQIISKEKIPYFAVPCAKLNRNLIIKNLSIPFKVIMGIKKAGKILDKVKPDVIFSKGGFVAIPTVIAAKKRKIPVIAHESDYTIGLANKLTAKFCDKILTTFPETAKEIKNAKYVGPPLKHLNTNKSDALKYFELSGKKPIILVTGGSLGAQAINNALREALPKLLLDFDVLHICGKGNLTNTKFSQGYQQREFISDMSKAFAVSDVCVSRAGSNTLFELLSLKKPCVLIPLPKGTSRGDQVFNAEYFQKKGLVNVLYQNTLTPESLITSITSTYSNRKNFEKSFNAYPIENSCMEISKILSSYVNH